MITSDEAALVWPVVAQVALTATVWTALYVARLGEMSRRSIDPQPGSQG